MSTLGHSWGDWVRQTNWAIGELRLRRHQDLEYVGPFEVYICVKILSSVIASRINDESIICMNIPCLVSCMITRAKSPSWISPVGPCLVRMRLILRSRRENKVHQMRDRGLPLAISSRLHDGGLSSSILIRKPRSSLILVLLFRGLDVPWCSGRCS